MDSGVKIAISGKGGVGKTTICAIWANLFAEDGLEVIAIDADPDANLSSAFGLSKTQSPEPLINMKSLIAERTGTGKDAVGAYFKLNPVVGDLPETYCVPIPLSVSADKKHNENGSLKMLVLGGITRAGSGCACSEGAFLRALLTHIILQRQEAILVDLDAGVECMGRSSIEGIDALVVVVEPGSRSIETALSISQMAKKLNIKQVAAITNKITDPQQGQVVRSKLGDLPVIAEIGYTPSIQQADMTRSNVFDADSNLISQLSYAKDNLLNLIAEQK